MRIFPTAAGALTAQESSASQKVYCWALVRVVVTWIRDSGSLVAGLLIKEMNDSGVRASEAAYLMSRTAGSLAHLPANDTAARTSEYRADCTAASSTLASLRTWPKTRTRWVERGSSRRNT